MQHKPWQFKILALIFILIGVSLPLQMMMLYEHGLGEVHLAINKLTLLNKVIMFLCFASAYYTFKASRMVFLTIPLNIVAVFVNNYYVAKYGQHFLPGITFVASLSFLMLPAMLLFSRPWLVLMHPERQWWRHEQRFNIQLPIKFLAGPVEMLKSVDVSASGMFLSCAQSLFEQGALVQVAVPIGNQNLSLQAKVVRKADSSGKYPEGVGFEFTNAGVKERYLLRTYLNKQF